MDKAKKKKLGTAKLCVIMPHNYDSNKCPLSVYFS